jgi:predicted N-acetyltransferase YhbS
MGRMPVWGLPIDPSSVPISVADRARAPDILSLVESAGWAYALADIERLIGVDPEGMLVATAGRGRADEVLGCVYASRWGSLGFIGLLLVRADMRGRGLGGRLAREGVRALRARGCACVGLDAVPEATTLYSRLGFVPEWESMRLAVDTSVEERPPASVRARAAVDDDMAAVLVLDHHGWGADRSRLLQLLHGSGAASVAVAPEEGPVRAFGVLRSGVRGWRMGPWVAETGREGADAARAVLSWAMDVSAKESLALGVPAYNAQAVEALNRVYAVRMRSCTRMYLGDPGPARSPAGSWAIGAPEKG